MSSRNVLIFGSLWTFSALAVGATGWLVWRDSNKPPVATVDPESVVRYGFRSVDGTLRPTAEDLLAARPPVEAPPPQAMPLPAPAAPLQEAAPPAEATPSSPPNGQTGDMAASPPPPAPSVSDMPAGTAAPTELPTASPPTALPAAPPLPAAPLPVPPPPRAPEMPPTIAGAPPPIHLIPQPGGAARPAIPMAQPQNQTPPPAASGAAPVPPPPPPPPAPPRSSDLTERTQAVPVAMAVAPPMKPPAPEAETPAPAPQNAPGLIIISVPDRKLRYFPADGSAAVTFPVAIGKSRDVIPFGVSEVVRKRRNPTWRPTPTMRRNDPGLPESVPPGPKNPLGAYALDLGWTYYAIHGTNDPRSIGRAASSGCFRMHPKDIAALFPTVPVGTRVEVIDAPLPTGPRSHPA